MAENKAANQNGQAAIGVQPENMKKEKVEQNDPKGEILKSFKPDLITEVNYLISIYQPVVIVDCHMHIMSAGCSPLPFLWRQIADKSVGFVEAIHLLRATIEGAGMLFGTAADLVTLQPLRADQVEVPGTGGMKTEYRKQEFRQSVPVGKKTTFDIGKEFTDKRHNDVYDYMLKQELYKDADEQTGTDKPNLFLLCVAMPMDMEYAHIDGYYGLKIYNAVYQDEKIIHYWTPLHGRFFKGKRDGNTYYHNEDHSLASANIDALSKSAFKNIKPMIKVHGLPGLYFTDAVDDDGNAKMSQGIPMSVKATPCIVPNSETKRYEQWEKQLQYTELAVLADPLKLLPLFHYDPRRWQVADNPKGNTTPFENVGESGLYMGFKIYTAQGYRPWDMRLPILRDFYRRCSVDRVPIMNHCTPEGAYNFDRAAYYEFTHPNDLSVDDQKLACGGNAVKYFNDNFVAPKAWEPVLKRFPKLYLCLAHFGGATDLKDKERKAWKELTAETWCGDIIRMIKSKDYPNLYADISSSFANEEFRAYFKEKIYPDPDFKEIRNHILFGSDWYMTLLDKIEYLEYCRVAKDFLDKIDTSLWIIFTQANPYRFYRLDEQIQRIAKNIIEKRQNDEKVHEVLRPLEQAQIDKIEEEAAYIQAANTPYEKHEES